MIMQLLRHTPAILAVFMAAACSAGNNNGSGGSPGDGEGAGNEGGATTAVATSSQGGSASSFGNTTGTSMQAGCDAGPDEDKDQDGFSINQNDCNDCDPNVNPNAIEVIVDGGMGGGGGVMEPADEDCDGEIDNVAGPCDTGLPFDSTDAMDGARAIELCKTATPESDWGVVSAQWVRANGSPVSTSSVQYGILPNFGPSVAPRAGESVLALSSGTARLPGQAGACTSHACASGAGTPPPGFPQAVPGCDVSSTINDDIGLEVTLKAPSNATGYKFDFKFYSFEYAEYVCTLFNDQFIALVNPAPMGSQNGNISFDSNSNPVSVNIAFFDVCNGCDDFAAYCYTGTCPTAPNPCCPSGGAELMGNGFDNAFGSNFEDAGGTSWLQTTAPIGPGESFSVRYTIWDVQDTAYDSTSVIDNFEWIANGGTVIVGTNPVPE
ncbi:MAG: choice-of-anchor L domain-containing protein [Myxococcales bacterium]|nr:choice-of-anchor L domain-containing protein [Myxococcales bacterium]